MLATSNVQFRLPTLSRCAWASCELHKFRSID